MDMETIIKIITAMISFISGYKLFREFNFKQTTNDMELLVKFFSTKDEIEKFKKHPEYVKDSVCNSISYLKGHPFHEIELLICNEKLTLIELKNLLSLKEMKILVWNNDRTKLELSNKFQEIKDIKSIKDIFHRVKYIYHTSVWFNRFLFFVYFITLVIVSVELMKKFPLIYSLPLLAFAVLIVEIPILNKEDKIKKALKFKKENLDNFLNTQQRINMS